MSFPSISASVLLTGTILHDRKKVIDLAKEEHPMRAAHINPQGRLKLPGINEPPCYDLTEQTEGFFKLEDWAVDNGLKSGSASYSVEFILFDDLLAQLYESPTARSLINFASQKDWSLSMQSLEDGAFDLDPERRILSLNNYNLRLPVFEKPAYFRQSLILSLVKGLRDIWHLECRQPYEAGLSVESVLFLERVRAADCDVIALLVAWELRGEGVPEIWRHLIGTAEGDMAMRFSQTLESAPSKTFDGSALIEAFHEWFASPVRVAAIDHLTLEMIDGMLEDKSACRKFGTKRPTIDFIESLSRLADRNQYLRGFGSNLLNDPHFSGLQDDVNQAHFLQIRREMDSVTVNGVSFRSAALARKIFPE
jgi:hypothetical protein